MIKLWLTIRYLSLRFLNEGLTYRAASLAYATLLAIVPLFLVTFTILAIFPFFSGTTEKIQDFIFHNFVAESARTISNYFGGFLNNVNNLSKINILSLVVLNLLMLHNINIAFNSVWQTEFRIRFSLRFLIYLVVLLFSPLILGGILILTSFFLKLPYLQNLIENTLISHSLIWITPHLITFFTFSLLNWALPSCQVCLRHAILGGFITTLIFETTKTGFTFYLSKFSTYKALYGALAALPLFLIWLYVSWLIILFGALVTNFIAVGIPAAWQQKLKTT